MSIFTEWKTVSGEYNLSKVARLKHMIAMNPEVNL